MYKQDNILDIVIHDLINKIPQNIDFKELKIKSKTFFNELDDNVKLYIHNQILNKIDLDQQLSIELIDNNIVCTLKKKLDQKIISFVKQFKSQNLFVGKGTFKAHIETSDKYLDKNKMYDMCNKIKKSFAGYFNNSTQLRVYLKLQNNRYICTLKISTIDIDTTNKIIKKIVASFVSNKKLQHEMGNFKVYIKSSIQNIDIKTRTTICMTIADQIKQHFKFDHQIKLKVFFQFNNGLVTCTLKKINL